MAVLTLPRFLRGGPRPAQNPAPDWDAEAEALRCVGEWLALLPSDEARFRVLTYWMWRLKSGDSPNIQNWIDSVAEQSAVKIAETVGFKDSAG